MGAHTPCYLGIFSEACLAFSAVIISIGIITGAVGSLLAGAALIATGLAVGAVGPFSRTLRVRKSGNRIK